MEEKRSQYSVGFNPTEMRRVERAVEATYAASRSAFIRKGALMFADQVLGEDQAGQEGEPADTVAQ